MTFSNYKNSNTFKALVGISSYGVITFVSLYPGSISDKELTRQSGILDLLNCGDSVMADRGFDIEDDLILRGVHLNMPLFLRGKKQFEENELTLWGPWTLFCVHKFLSFFSKKKKLVQLEPLPIYICLFESPMPYQPGYHIRFDFQQILWPLCFLCK